MGVNLVKDKLFYIHRCEGCSRCPSENPNQKCSMCGWSRNQINEVKTKCEVMTRLYEKYKNGEIVL